MSSSSATIFYFSVSSVSTVLKRRSEKRLCDSLCRFWTLESLNASPVVSVASCVLCFKKNDFLDRRDERRHVLLQTGDSASCIVSVVSDRGDDVLRPLTPFFFFLTKIYFAAVLAQAKIQRDVYSDLIYFMAISTSTGCTEPIIMGWGRGFMWWLIQTRH